MKTCCSENTHKFKEKVWTVIKETQEKRKRREVIWDGES